MSAPRAEWECFDIFFGFPDARELRVTVLDSDAEHVFTRGAHFIRNGSYLAGPDDTITTT